MRTKLVVVVICGLLYVTSVGAGENKMGTATSQISLFKVPFQCPAAPQIGCGSHAKPILLELERDSSVSEAWLNRAGTKIAVMWKPQSNAEARSNVATKLKKWDATEIQGKSREEGVEDFSSGEGWYRGTAVDRLSDEEAGIIAARLVRRVQAKTTVAKDKAEGLEQALAKMFKEQLTNENVSQEKEPVRLKDVAGEYLNEDQIRVLKEAIESGLRPLPNEK